MVQCLVISLDGRVLTSGSGDRTVRLWSLPDGDALKTLEGHAQQVSCLAISPDGRLLASGSYDTTVRLWGLEPLRHLPVGQTSLEDLAWVRGALQGEGLSSVERSWLEFLLALIRWHRRFDIEVEEMPQRIPVGEFDIEID
jgi:WD40 repeat protein